MQNHTVVEASGHVYNTSEDAQVSYTNTMADTPQRNSLQEAFEYDLRKTELLEKVLVKKTELINTVLSYSHQLEQTLAKEQCQKRSLQEQYKRERAYSACISQTLLKSSP
jgi:hypothetical protein